VTGRRTGPPPPSDPDRGIWQGRSVARRIVSPDGLVVLVGKTAADNDILTFKLASPRDFWLHVSGESGSHVVVRNPDGLDTLPRATKQLAAALAAGYSKARRGGRLAVHLARVRDIGKPRNLPPGKVTVSRFDTVRAAPRQIEELQQQEEEP
jgi:predicted ribosome quality control (RQC) complex YloA/Tae2 family protein